MQTAIKQPLTNVQLELLKTFSHQLTEHELVELQKTIAAFFAKRLTEQADKIWGEKNGLSKTLTKY